MKLSEQDQQALQKLDLSQVRCWSWGGGPTRVELHDGRLIEYRGDLAWIVGREIRAYELGLAVGTTVRAATANDLIDRLLAQFGENRGGESHQLASERTGIMKGVAGAQMQGSRWPAPSEVYGEEPAPIVVHCLAHGETACGFGRGKVPGDWPPGHVWVRLEEAAQVTCAACKVELGRAATAPPERT